MGGAPRNQDLRIGPALRAGMFLLTASDGNGCYVGKGIYGDDSFGTTVHGCYREPLN